MGSTAPMSLLDSLYVSVFGMTVVFVVLVGLSFLVKLQTSVVSRIAKNKTMDTPLAVAQSETAEPAAQTENASAPDRLQLVNVDEKTAAVIMAIVSDTINVPPRQLAFKHIKALGTASSSGSEGGME